MKDPGTVRSARLAIRKRLHVCNMYDECKECPRIKGLLDRFEAAVRHDERNRFTDQRSA